MSKPFSKHKFRPMELTPKSCSTCGQNKDHENHQGRKYPKRGMSTALLRPDWKVYDAEPEPFVPWAVPPVHLNGGAQGSGVSLDGTTHNRAHQGDVGEGKARPEDGPEVPRPFPVAEIDLSQEQEYHDD